MLVVGPLTLLKKGAMIGCDGGSSSRLTAVEMLQGSSITMMRRRILPLLQAQRGRSPRILLAAVVVMVCQYDKNKKQKNRSATCEA